MWSLVVVVVFKKIIMEVIKLLFNKCISKYMIDTRCGARYGFLFFPIFGVLQL